MSILPRRDTIPSRRWIKRSKSAMCRAAALSFALSATLWGQAGPTRPDVDSSAADRGKRVYLQFCVNCHGTQAKGTEDGPDLIRSAVMLHDVLHDEAGSELALTLKKLANHKGDLT